MDNLVEQIETLFLPDINRLASDMQERFPTFKFNLWQGPVGSKTGYQGYEIGMECVFPGVSTDATDNIALSVSLCNPGSKPRITAGVVWGHPSGYSEKHFRDDWLSNSEWPEATPEVISHLRETFSALVRKFESAVKRGGPPVQKRR